MKSHTIDSDDPSVTFIESIESSVRRFPERTAVASRAGSCSYRTLWERSGSLACYIVETIGSSNAPLVIFGHKSPLVIICMLACARSGHAYVPVDISTPLPRVHDILVQTASPLILAAETLNLDVLDLEESQRGELLDSNRLASIMNERNSCAPDRKDAVSGEDTHYIIFTSGSTGAPKGVEVTAACLDHFYTWPLSMAGTEPSDPTPKVYLNQALFSFDLSVYELAMSLSSGGTLVCADTPLIADMAAFFDFLKENQTQVWSVTPSFLEMCLADRSFDTALLPSLETVLACGETLPVSVSRRFIERFPDTALYNTYGPTESTVAVTAIRITADMLSDDTLVPVGYAKPGTVITIDRASRGDEDDGADSSQGEILITGSTVAKGYFNRPDLTEQSFECDSNGIRTYRTGDLGTLDADGCLHCLGRADSQIKLNGFRIELGDIENNLAALPAIRSAAVVCVRREGKPHHLVGFICLENPRAYPEDPREQRSFTQSLKEQLKQNIPHYMVPRKLIVSDQLPLNNNGKVDRKALLATLR